MKVILVILLLVSNPALHADDVDHVASAVKVSGDVKLFTNPSPQPRGEGPHALLQGQHYQVRKLRPGMKVEKGQVIQTSKGGGCRLIFRNGDVITVGENTLYRMRWEKKAKEVPLLDLLFGKIRSQILKGGPRSDLKVRSKTMALGVRGTDFYIADPSRDGDGKITVIRGAVSVQPASAENAEPVVVKAGTTAQIADTKSSAPKAQAAKETVVLRPSTKQELVNVEKDTVISKSADSEAGDLSPEAAAEIKTLEEKAATNILQDIKEEDPELYATISKEPPEDIATLNTLAVKKAYSQAPASEASNTQKVEQEAEAIFGETPKTEEKTKPTEDELTPKKPEPEEPRELRLYAAIGPGSYKYNHRHEGLDYKRDGGLGNGFLNLDWDKPRWLLALRLGNRSLNKFTPEEKEEPLSYVKLQGTYKFLHDKFFSGMRLSITSVDHAMIYKSKNGGIETGSNEMFQILLGAAGGYTFSPNRELLGFFDFAAYNTLSHAKLKRNEEFTLGISFRHHPFDNRVAVKYMWEYGSRDLSYDKDDYIKGAKVGFSYTMAALGLGYAF